jgi:hypothetical protein
MVLSIRDAEIIRHLFHDSSRGETRLTGLRQNVVAADWERDSISLTAAHDAMVSYIAEAEAEKERR